MSNPTKKHRTSVIPARCDCDGPARLAGQPCGATGSPDRRCERCYQIEKSQTADKVSQARRKDVKENGPNEEGQFDSVFTKGFIISIQKACDKFFTDRGMSKNDEFSEWAIAKNGMGRGANFES